MSSSHLGPNPVRSRPILPEKTSGNSWQLVTKKFTSCHLSLTCLRDLLPFVFFHTKDWTRLESLQLFGDEFL